MVLDVIDPTQDEYVESSAESITCDDLFPPAVDGKSEYRVEKILDCYQPDEHEYNFQYLVKWFGYPLSEATWEWECNLSNCTMAIVDFHTPLELRTQNSELVSYSHIQ